jgi:4a-hydroxytetrahydrobiopterin dehydratase
MAAMDLLTRTEASDAVTDLGWRYVLGALRAQVTALSLTHATEVASRAVHACAGDADEHLVVDLRPDRVHLALRTRAMAGVTQGDVDLAHRISAGVRDLGLRTEAGHHPSVQTLEIAIDALDIPAIRPFWKAIMSYVDEFGAGPDGAIVDPAGLAAPIWFQQMDLPRPQRNRIHLDISVPHDEAERRIEAALAAGGRLAYTDEAPAFWVLADAEGNEACVCTWQGRD